MTKAVLGVIGGSGIYDLPGLENVREQRIASPWGEPSGALRIGAIAGLPVVFLPRHDKGHRLSPSDINYRANIDVLKRCGVTDILAISAIGSLRDEFAPGHVVAVDQIIDHTQARERSFFGPGLVAHVSLADPVCPRLSGLAASAARAAGATVHAGGCYIAIEGPQFSTRAESRLYRGWGADVIGMTAMPEARLAREAELPYALLGLVTDWDSWREDERDVVAEEILGVMKANAEMARSAVSILAKGLPARRKAVPIDRSLDHAIVTAREMRDPALAARLDAVAGRVLR